MDHDLLPDLLIAIEQQLQSPHTPYVSKTLKRLRETGLEESAAKIQMALCLGEQTDTVLRTKRPFDEKAYRKALDELPMADDCDGEEE
jgi:hypothetical protein